MKMMYLAFFAYMLVSMQLTSYGQNEQKLNSDASTIVPQLEVYYFHFERRCSTCIAVEQNSKKAVEELYPEQVKSGEYFFKAVNLDEPGGKEIGNKLGVEMQTLLVVHGNKKVDITGEGFMYVDNYERLRSEVKKAVDKALQD